MIGCRHSPKADDRIGIPHTTVIPEMMDAIRWRLPRS